MDDVWHRNCSVCCHHLRLVFQIFKTIPRLNHGLSWRILLWITFCWVLLLFHSLTSFSLPISHPFHHQPASAFAPWVAGIAHGPSPLVAHKSSTPLQRGPAPVVGWVTYPPGGLQVESELEDIPARLYLYLDCYHTMMQVTNNHKNDNITFWDFWGNNTYRNLHIQLVCGVYPKHPEANINSILWKWCNLQNSIQQKQRMVVRLFPTWTIFGVPMLLTQLP